MDGVSGVTAVLGLLAPAIEGASKLWDIVNNIKDAPEEIRFIKADLHAAVSVLDRMDSFCRGDDGRQIHGEDVGVLSDTIAACRESCAEFQKLLNRWLRHSKDGKVFWADRLRLALLEKGRIEAFQGRLVKYRTTITTILETDSVLKTTQQEFIPEATRNGIVESYTQQLVNKITEATAVAQDIDLKSRQISEMTIAEVSPSDQGSFEELRHDAQRELGFLRDDNWRLQRTCEDALKKLEATRTTQKIKNVSASEDSIALAGYVDTDNDFRVDQDISNVMAKKNSLVIAGVAKNIDISSFFARR